MAELFAGDYGDGYFDNRWKIGLAHVRVGVRPHWVEAVMSFLRAEGLKAMAGEIADIEALTDRYASLVKVLDLDLMIINLAYGEERLERLSSFTGMSRKLLERCVTQAKK
jgi:exoribonuclease II